MSDSVGAPCCQICGGKSDGQLICNSCEGGGKPEYVKKTTVQERAYAYGLKVKYIGGEVQLAMQAAVMTATVQVSATHPPMAAFICQHSKAR